MITAIGNLSSEVELYFPNLEKHLVFELIKEAPILRQEESTQGIVCITKLTPRLMSKWKPFMVERRR